jgi:hypothetical protein
MSMIKVETVLHTDGTGLWSRRVGEVQVTRLEVGYVNEQKTFGELRVYFNENIWSPRHQGLIYTDPLFIKELRQFLKSMGMSARGVDYSEAGMQGRNYVSLDVDGKFLKSYFKKILDSIET